VQIHPIKPMLKAPKTKRLKLKYDDPLSNFASNVNLRRYNKVRDFNQYLSKLSEHNDIPKVGPG